MKKRLTICTTILILTATALFGAWGNLITATQLTTITTEKFFDETPQLNPGEQMHGQVRVDFPGSPTDNAVISIYGSLDGVNYAGVPAQSWEIGNANDNVWVDFFVVGAYQFRVGVKRSGTTDTFATADFQYRLNGVDAQ